MRNIKNNVLIITFLLFVLFACSNQRSLETETAAVKNIVETYCKADLNGARLSAKNYSKSDIHNIITVGDFTEPGWDTASLIKKYLITAVKLNEKNATVTVSYDALGEITGTEEVILNKKTEECTFDLVKINGKWKLKNPYDLNPHISINTAIKHIEELYNAEKACHHPQAPAIIIKLNKMKKDNYGM